MDQAINGSKDLFSQVICRCSATVINRRIIDKVIYDLNSPYDIKQGKDERQAAQFLLVVIILV